MRYHLEVYCAGENGRDPIMSYSAGGPFMSFSRGDRIETMNWEGYSHLNGLVVESVEHIVWEIKDSHVSHKVMVRTRPAPTKS